MAVERHTRGQQMLLGVLGKPSRRAKVAARYIKTNPCLPSKKLVLPEPFAPTARCKAAAQCRVL